MRFARIPYLAIIIAVLVPATADAAAHGLRVDQTARPLGVDNPHPALSWLPSIDQTAYRVRVSTSAGAQDVWDSGKVASSDTVGITYDGPALKAATRYFWTVQVWGRRRARLGSERADLVRDRAARRLGRRAVDRARRRRLALVVGLHARRRLHAEVRGGELPVPGRGRLELLHVADQHGDRARGRSCCARTRTSAGGSRTSPRSTSPRSSRPRTRPAAPHPHQGGGQHDHDVGRRHAGRHAHRHRDPGKGTIGFRHSSTNGVPERAAYDNLVVRGLDGTVLFSDDVSATPDPAFPQVPVVNGQLEPGDGVTLLSREASAPVLRHEFTLDKPVASARAYVYGLGFAELRLNGAKVGDRALTPTPPVRAAQPVQHL